ncbi:MAG TPA: efflux RND transporter permease subunit, partial [Bacteroidales bacterium]|nr:efflux RND transporter permease subunit [Bacteroidales bacterium]
FEFKAHQNKIKALSRIIQKVGFATLLTNLTTAVGFGAFIFSKNQLMYEFGLIASINIILLYIFSLFLIPIFFSYLPPPQSRHIKHLNNLKIKWLVDKILFIVQNKRGIVFLVSFMLFLISIIGTTRLTTTGNIVDDIPIRDPLYKDLLFFEKNFKGVMPFEISIDTKKKRGVMRLSTLKKINQLQDSLKKYPQLSSPLSIVEVVKFARQAFYNGDSSMYDLPSNNELMFMSDYIPKIDNKKKTILNSFVDTNMQVARISVQIANIGTKEIKNIKNDIKPKIDSLFDNADYKVTVTGTSIVFLKGTEYLTENLLQSLIIAIILISILMALLFTSWRMVIVALIPNILPLLCTAGMMGYMNIAIKPSTIIIFSIALGISVDNSILFLSRYRQQLRDTKWEIRKSILNALKETGYSMMYSSSVLFLGFAIFIFSSFGGTQSLGYLISFTLFIALCSNLLLLPSILLYFDNIATTKAFEEPFLEIFDEEHDIELDELQIENNNENNINN